MKQTENNEMDLLLRSLAKQASSLSDTVNGRRLTRRILTQMS